MVTVVRTESQLARFNTARALFEKGFVDASNNKSSASSKAASSSGRSSRLNSDGSRHSLYTSSRSPSPVSPAAPSPLQRHQSAPAPVGRSPSPLQHVQQQQQKPAQQQQPLPPPSSNGQHGLTSTPNKMAPVGKPEPPAKTEKARISSKELIEKQKNWIQHFKGTGSVGGVAGVGLNNKPALQAKPAILLSSNNPDRLNQINSQNSKPVTAKIEPGATKEKKDWAKERSGVLSGWMASPTIHSSNNHHTLPSTVEPVFKESLNFSSTRQRFEKKESPVTTVASSVEVKETVQTETIAPAKSVPSVDPEPPRQEEKETVVPKTDSDGSASVIRPPSPVVSNEAEVSQVESVIEEALERIDRVEEKPVTASSPTTTSVDVSVTTTPATINPVTPAVTAAVTSIVSDETPPVSFLLNSSLPESEEVFFYDNSVTSARFDEWQLRTPTQLDDSPVLKSSAPLDFDALLSDGDETKQLEPDDEELFRTVSADLSETELSPISSPPPEFTKDVPSPYLPPRKFRFLSSCCGRRHSNFWF